MFARTFMHAGTLARAYTHCTACKLALRRAPVARLVPNRQCRALGDEQHTASAPPPLSECSCSHGHDTACRWARCRPASRRSTRYAQGCAGSASCSRRADRRMSSPSTNRPRTQFARELSHVPEPSKRPIPSIQAYKLWKPPK